MAHRILGLDIGHRLIKAAVLDKTMRSTSLSALEMEAVEAPWDHEARTAALGRLVRRVLRPDDVVVTGLPATLAMHRVLQFPFSDERSLRESVGFELGSHIPIPVEDVIVDHTVLRAEEGEGLESDVLAVGLARQIVEDRLRMLRAAGVEARKLNLVPLALPSVLGLLPGSDEGSTMVLDIGATGSQAVFVEDGRVRLLRTLSNGSDAVRERFSANFKTEGHDGDLLVTHTLLMPPDMEPEQPNEHVLLSATSTAIAPWLREVRQAMAVWSRGGREGPDRIVLTGGMAGMRGLSDYLEAVLRVPVRTPSLSELDLIDLGDTSAYDDACLVAVSLALQGTEHRAPQEMDFRRGEFAYEGDFKFLRKRLPQLAAFAVIAVCLLGVRTTIDFRALVHEESRQMEQLRAFSKTLTNKELRTFSKFKVELNRPLPVDLASYYPDMSAIKAFDDISALLHKVTEPPEYKPPGPAQALMPGSRLAQVAPRMRAPTLMPPRGRPAGIRARVRMPPGAAAADQQATAGDDAGRPDDNGGEPEPFSGHKIELLSADIDRLKGTLRGDCDTQDALLAFQQALEKHPCFHKVKSSSDRISFERHRDWFRFNLRFEIACAAPASRKRAGKSADVEEKD